ncbi:restriction endonuclease [Salmonella enterica subsp. enterica serovar Worthington]|uniref:Restriction endonuclease n=1 Tax=Salmonella enterica subsp. enterica serovar Ank TaxID=1173578 RepID=A0A5I2X750_SALET|nr:restriction endonuclease [Salmonella enterica]EBS1325791.1 restriction endonuclease [Salmonella enterica subsp. enterica serovar Muenchen]EBV7252025.1 restriction endonuclease [Salmonella enterica subsp. enterica serovar Pomona]ECF3886432.1 restriction endonuclease [Salmonella enterica subsp. enterica serovar Ank]EDJ9087961.1 restriction endonuclease [Salmonella enterica subsp. enterica serovar Vitkin]EGI5053421.1 restriction endonuclease [Salmonella enterica subsp. enterica serovar Worthin
MLTTLPLFLLLCSVAILVVLRLKTPGARERRHRRYRETAQRVLVRLPELSSDGARLNYLRKINPYVFEELLLLSFERQGMKVVRNRAYSGDGGLDGQVFIDGKRWLIQAKRYSRSISPQHISAFAGLLSQEGCHGFFIHTGRMGQLSRVLLQQYPHVHLISGQCLLDLLASNPDWHAQRRASRCVRCR